MKTLMCFNDNSIVIDIKYIIAMTCNGIYDKGEYDTVTILFSNGIEHTFNIQNIDYCELFNKWKDYMAQSQSKKTSKKTSKKYKSTKDPRSSIH